MLREHCDGVNIRELDAGIYNHNYYYYCHHHHHHHYPCLQPHRPPPPGHCPHDEQPELVNSILTEWTTAAATVSSPVGNP